MGLVLSPSEPLEHMRGGGTKGHAPSTARTICVMAGTTIRNDTALAPRGQNLKRSGATCVMHASLGIFVRPTTSSSMTMRPTAASGWRTTASRAGWAGRTMTSSSSNLSPSTWPTHPKLGSITYPKTRSAVGRISRRSSPATFKAHTCGPTSPRI
jgi:hypothetical protein